MIDWKKERKSFAVCEENSYFLSAATGPLPLSVADAYKSGITLLYEKGCIEEEKLLSVMDETRLTCSGVLQASPAELAFLPNTSLAMSYLAMMLKKDAQKKNISRPEIIFSSDEFPSSVLPWIHLGFQPVEINPQKGITTVDSILQKTSSNTMAVIQSAVQFISGYRQDLKLLGEGLKKKSIPFIVNATQGLGAIPLYPKQIHCTAMISSLHKWVCAGFGSALLFLDEEFAKEHNPPFLGWNSIQETWRLSLAPTTPYPLPRSLELGTSPLIHFMAIKEAFKQIQRLRVESIFERNWNLAKTLCKGLENKGIKLYSTQDWDTPIQKSKSSSIVSFYANKPDDVVKKLKNEYVHVSVRKGVIRAAIHYFNDEYDIEQLLAHI